MTKTTLQTPRLDPRGARDMLASALAAAESIEPREEVTADVQIRPGTGTLSQADPGEIRALPAQVTGFAWMTDGHHRWLWCETTGGQPEMGHAVIDLPAGRYLVDSLDTSTGRWIMREAAQGGPLVIGLALTGHPVVLRIWQAAGSQPESARKRSTWHGPAAIVFAVVVSAAVTPSFRGMTGDDPIVPGAGVSRIAQLSDYLPSLRRTPGDTPVFVMEGREAGGTLLVLGGTHADEPAGYLAAVVLIERVTMLRGRILVVPRANASGFTHNFPQEGHPARFEVKTARGSRTFTYGARATNPVHQWPDPQVYTHRASGQTLSGTETRNLNRAYPGRPDGTLTERIAAGIMALMGREQVDLAIDLHEASPEYPVVNTIVAHQRAVDLGAVVAMNLQSIGMSIGLETSPESLHGLSHREWGDATPALAVLMETTNPVQGRLRGRTGEAQVTGGRDSFYVLASSRGRLAVPFPDDGWPLAVRVARHLAAVNEFARVASELAPERTIELSDVPEYQAVIDRGAGAFLNETTGPVH